MKKYGLYKAKIAESWDKNLCERVRDLEDGHDKTYLDIISRYVVDKVKESILPSAEILDVGCGCGYLTHIISETHPNITGIDISGKSISYAKKKYTRVEFSHVDIYDFEAVAVYDLCVATMVVHNLPCLKEFFEKISVVLKENGHLLLTSLHPAFWPEDKIGKAFKYKQSGVEYEVPFRGRLNQRYTSPVSYFHRTLEAYQNEITKKGFIILNTRELCEYDDYESGSFKTNPHIISWFLQRS